MKQNIIEILLKDIQNCKIFFIDVSFPVDDNLLENSLIENGQLTPILISRKNNEFFIIDGRKRFFLMEKLNFKKITLKILNYSSEIINFIKFLKINLYRKFNPIEISNLLKYSENYFQDKILTKYIFSRLQLKYSSVNLKNYLSLQHLTHFGKTLLVNEKLNLNLAIKLSKLDEKSQNKFLKLCENLKLNSNKQKKVFERIFDISKREDLNFYETIEKYFKKYSIEEYSKALEDEFFQNLLKIHSPDYYNFIEKFNNQKNLVLSNVKGLNIYSPSNFEDNTLKVEIFFKTYSELKEKLEKLKEFNFQL